MQAYLSARDVRKEGSVGLVVTLEAVMTRGVRKGRSTRVRSKEG